jgi:hypothetical protein
MRKELGARCWHPSPPLAVHLNGTGFVPVPTKPGRSRQAQKGAKCGFHRDSNPGIRRPRWGGVVEGVAGQIRHPLAYQRAAKLDCESLGRPTIWPKWRGQSEPGN